jgi:CRISPR system Cascade subunit CasA
LRENVLVEHLAHALNMAESVARQLWGAARTLATLVLSPEADLESGRKPAREDLDQLMRPWAIERHYWVQLETRFQETMEALPKDADAALAGWQETVRRAAWNAFDQVADQLRHDAHKLKAVVRARGQLTAGLTKALPS